MRFVRFFTLALFFGLALTACGAFPLAGGDAPQPATPIAQPPQAPWPSPAQDLARSDDQGVVTAVATLPDSSSQSSLWPKAVPALDLARTDSQGAVTVVVTPLSLNAPGETLDFEVAMDTHSVDLSMDLAALAALSADNGRTVQATGWDAPQGGHHVSGKLSFPASAAGVSVLEGAARLTLILRDVDVPQRVFVWELSAQ